MENGYIVVKNAFTPEQAAEWTKTMWIRLNMDPNDKSTWTRERVHMPWHKREPVSSFAPKVCWKIFLHDNLRVAVLGMGSHKGPSWRSRTNRRAK